MKSGHSEIITLYKELLEVFEKEKEELSASDIDKVEYYCSLKEGLIQKIAELTGMPGNGLAGLNSEQKETLEPLLRKILLLHDAGTKAVQEMRNSVNSELAGLNTAKTAFRAYTAYKK